MKRDPSPHAVPALPAQAISLDVLREKYLKQGEHGEADVLQRVARALASVEKEPLRAEWERQGDFGVFFEYNRLTRDEPYTVITGVTGIGTPTLRVPATSMTSGAVQLGTVREAFGAGFSKIIAGGWDFRFSAKSEDKSGARLWGRGGAAEFAAEPIDSNTRLLEAAVSYTRQKFQITAGYYGSWYTNRFSMVETSLTTLATNTWYSLSLPLDNNVGQAIWHGENLALADGGSL